MAARLLALHFCPFWAETTGPKGLNSGEGLDRRFDGRSLSCGIWPRFFGSPGRRRVEPINKLDERVLEAGWAAPTRSPPPDGALPTARPTHPRGQNLLFWKKIPEIRVQLARFVNFRRRRRFRLTAWPWGPSGHIGESCTLTSTFADDTSARRSGKVSKLSGPDFEAGGMLLQREQVAANE
jgi:hypothetical protein